MLDNIYKIDKGWKSCAAKILVDMDIKKIPCAKYTILIPEKTYQEMQSDKSMYTGKTEEALENINKDWTRGVFNVAFKIDTELKDEMKVIINE